MLKEKVKLALEALEKADAVIYSEYCGTDREELQICEPAIKALEEVLVQQEQGEHVAVKHMMEWVDYLKRKSDYGQHMQIPSEMSAGACWELAVELEQFINTTPQPKQEQGEPVAHIDMREWPPIRFKEGTLRCDIEHLDGIPLWPTQPKQEQGKPVAWKSVSDFEIYEMYNEPKSDAEMLLFARELEAELKRRNKCAALKP